ncbi:MAG: hypothetical protein LR015_00320 [Verrucomicrobia bacterium]|nr:hypothetical protein [Verrucomicrobiota bacterium]
MVDEAKQLADELSAGSQFSRQLWTSLIERLQSAGLDSRRIAKLGREVGNPGLLLNFSEWLSAGRLGDFANADAAVVTLYHLVDASPFDVRSWLLALKQMQFWMQSRQRMVTLSAVLGYIECTSAALSAQPLRMELSDGVEDMLNTYGFHGFSN